MKENIEENETELLNNFNDKFWIFVLISLALFNQQPAYKLPDININVNTGSGK